METCGFFLTVAGLAAATLSLIIFGLLGFAVVWAIGSPTTALRLVVWAIAPPTAGWIAALALAFPCGLAFFTGFCFICVVLVLSSLLAISVSRIKITFCLPFTANR
jgi:hypothetical protein